MVADASWFCWQQKNLQLRIHLLPRSSKDAVEGIHDGRLRIRVTAPPVEGKANLRLLNYLASEFGVPKRAVSIVSGEKSRCKTVLIHSPGQEPHWFQTLLINGTG